MPRTDGMPIRTSKKGPLGRIGWRALAVVALATAVGCGDPEGLGGDDQDGIVGGNYTFVVKVNDTVFSPPILKTQNLAMVTLTLTNEGSAPLGFKIGCLGAACFAESSVVEPIAPGTSKTTMFQTPQVEGIYEIGSNVPDGAQTGQFIIQ
jgi:hypothetical protein